MNLAKRIDAIEKTPQAQSARRVALALAGKLAMGELTSAELEMIISETPAELRAVFDRLTTEQLETIANTPIDQLPQDLRAICDEIIAADVRIYGGVQ